jgi:polyhydroxybutyrate depolymerase
MKIARILLVLFLGTASSLSAKSAKTSGTFIDSTMTWQDITRYYEVYLPVNLPPNPAMVLMLHGTKFAVPPGSPITLNWGWQSIADKNGFVLVKPASTYNSKSGQWNWNAYYLDGAFPDPAPDDSGFLRQLIVNLTAQYNIDPKRIYVVGFSSGAQMAHRVGVELSDLVAAIAPVSGPIVGQHIPPPVLPGAPLAPIAVQEWHGTLDQGLEPCNNGTTKYSGYLVTLATVDDSFNYWVQQNGCTMLQTTQALCTNGMPTPNLPGNDATGCVASNAEVQFYWESSTAHSYVPKNNTARWLFFAAHPKP